MHTALDLTHLLALAVCCQSFQHFPQVLVESCVVTGLKWKLCGVLVPLVSQFLCLHGSPGAEAAVLLLPGAGRMVLLPHVCWDQFGWTEQHRNTATCGCVEGVGEECLLSGQK